MTINKIIAREGLLVLCISFCFSSLLFAGGKYHIKDNNGYKEIWTKNNETGAETLLVDEVDAVANDTKDIQKIRYIYDNKIIQALDGNYIYFITDAWETSGALFKYDLTSDELVYLTDAYSVMQIIRGKYKGFLVIGKHQYPFAGSAVDLLWVFDPANNKNIELFAQEGAVADFAEGEYFQ